jgi:hypothetical protein
VKTLLCAFLTIAVASLSFADDQTFSRLKIPSPSGKQTAATLTFSDDQKSILVHPVKGGDVAIPYSEIDRCSYQYSKKHRITRGLDMTALGLVPVGVIVMFTKYKMHWLEIDYHQQDRRKWMVLRMDKKNYPEILDAVKAHTGIETEVLGNVDKRQK